MDYWQSWPDWPSEENAGLLKKDDLTLLGFLLEEVKESRKQNRRLFDSRKERLTASVAKAPF